MTGLRRCAAIAATCACLVPAAGEAAAQTTATVESQTSYRAYNVWDDWKWWQPDKCTQSQPLYVSEPAQTGRYPVVVYTHGALADWAGNAEGKAVARLAAAQGFVAAAPSYDSWIATSAAAVDGNAKCIFSAGNQGGALAQVCARPKADCSKGVAVIGFSLGGAVAGRAANHTRIGAAWLISVSGPAIPEAIAAPSGSRALPNDRLRITTGQSDVEVRSSTGQVTGLDLKALNALTGSSCQTTRCLRADGSGYYIVEHQEVADRVADHCYWLSVSLQDPANSCTSSPTFDPGFRPPATTPWSLLTGLDWLRSKTG